MWIHMTLTVPFTHEKSTRQHTAASQLFGRGLEPIVENPSLWRGENTNDLTHNRTGPNDGILDVRYYVDVRRGEGR